MKGPPGRPPRRGPARATPSKALAGLVSASAAAPLGAPRKPRLLWANCYCLLDTSSGASMAVREMLKQLAHKGYEIYVLGCAVFDAERGTAGMGEHWKEFEKRRGQQVTLADGPIQHHLYVTQSTRRNQMSSAEAGAWHSIYQQVLDQFKPDILFYYGGQTSDMLIPLEARLRGIQTAFYLANGNYGHTRWARDVHLVLTDSQATADFYKNRLGLSVTAIGAFIDSAKVVAQQHSRERVLFVNPRLEKGAGLMIRLAMMLEKRRPDIVFEVVESRGAWTEILRLVTKNFGAERESLANVVITPNTDDMRPIYGRARLLLAPSLWWESAGRVVAEAMLNGIPAMVSANGGMPEMVQDGGVVLRFGEQYHRKPYNLVPPAPALEPVAAQIEAFYDDEAHYAAMCERALRVGQSRHRLEASTQRLMQALEPLAQRRAGDGDTGAALQQWHLHGLDDRVVLSQAAAPDAAPGLQGAARP